MKVVLFSFCILFTNNYICFGLEVFEHREYNANLSSVVSIEIIKTPTVNSTNNSKKTFCTGAIISETLVLTAASCFKLYSPNEKSDNQTNITGIVYAGNHPNKVIKNMTKFNIVGFKISQYANWFLKNEKLSSVMRMANFAVVEVFPPMQLNDLNITPAKLPNRNQTIPNTTIIVGYGNCHFSKGKLQWSNETTTFPCATLSETNKIFCCNLTTKSKLAPTESDTGGPAFDENYNLIGVASRVSAHNGRFKNFIYYTIVSEQLDFLVNVTKDLNGNRWIAHYVL